MKETRSSLLATPVDAQEYDSSYYDRGYYFRAASALHDEEQIAAILCASEIERD